MSSKTVAPRRVLISGASVGGPATAYWLGGAGFDVTVVEKADRVRGGGYPIDIRGAAVEVVRRMGLLEPLRDAHIHTRSVSAMHPDGSRIATVKAPTGARDPAHADIEVPRGELTALLYEASRDRVDYVFDDSIATLDDHPGGVDIAFRSGRTGAYDLVIGADGLHSNTRRLAFGPEEQFHHYLGHCFAGFSVPNRFGLDHEVVLINTPGTMAALYAAGSRPDLHALLAFRSPLPSRADLADRDFQIESLTRAFANQGERTDWLLAQLADAPDLFFDTLSQIRTPAWNRGRVALVGDAGYAPSFLSGEGTSLALVGGYTLAAELAATEDQAAGLTAYEARLRDYVARNQALPTTGRRLMLPGTRAELLVRDLGLRGAALLSRLGLLDRAVPRAATAVQLPTEPSDRNRPSGVTPRLS
jgi:2-polyprenyl-6-methoxyphenol hydroxylase-like FAD-dependent oxidoreductase